VTHNCSLSADEEPSACGRRLSSPTIFAEHYNPLLEFQCSCLFTSMTTKLEKQAQRSREASRRYYAKYVHVDVFHFIPTTSRSNRLETKKQSGRRRPRTWERSVLMRKGTMLHKCKYTNANDRRLSDVSTAQKNWIMTLLQCGIVLQSMGHSLRIPYSH